MLERLFFLSLKIALLN